MAENKDTTMEKIVSLAKRRGFIFQGSEIYGGLAGTWDWGPRGVLLRNNIKNIWWHMFVDSRDDMHGVDAAILMSEKVWEASGHTAGFADPLVEDVETKKKYRADHLLEAAGINPAGMSISEMNEAIINNGVVSPEGNSLNPAMSFNLMFETRVGADGSQKSYLRPETAQGIFVNFKNVLDSMNPKLPFGIAQIGKAFRNEIAPRDFIFRVREMEQMEVEYFVRADEWEKHFAVWQATMNAFAKTIGLSAEGLHEVEINKADRAHYSERTIDFEFEFPFGQKELWGLAYRTDYDLKKHSEHSGESLTYFDDSTNEHFVPHVIEPSLGVERTVLAAIVSAYREDDLGGEIRPYLAFPAAVAPIKACVSPLLKNKPELVAKAREVYSALKKRVPHVIFDDNGNIGKRYRRQDEIGTPFCITIDFDTLGEKPALEGTVTLRHRDTGEQERLSIEEAIERIVMATMIL